MREEPDLGKLVPLIGTKHNLHFWIAKSPNFDNMDDGNALVVAYMGNFGLFEGSLNKKRHQLKSNSEHII